MRKLLIVLSLLALPGTARAEWRESSSAHFVVYGDTSESNLRTFSERLERYNAAMAVVTGITDQVPSPSNRVTVYIVGSVDAVRKLGGFKRSSYVGGFYMPRAGASLAIIPTVEGAGASGDLGMPMVTLLHEYTHHFLISNTSFPMPRWLSEGQAEFFSAASFAKDGSVSLGRPAVVRAPELFLARDVTAEDLLDPDEYARKRGKSTEYDAFYGKSWLLYHYLVMSGKRPGQLDAYEKALIAGKPMREAAIGAFGDLKVLEKELDAYLHAPSFRYFPVPAAKLQISPVTVRILRPGEAAIMPALIRTRVGVDKDSAPLALADARAVAAKYPAEPAVLSELAEAEYDAGNDKEAVAAADAAITADPGQLNAYVQKGYALMRMAEGSDDPKVWRATRAPFLALNAREHDNPRALYNYYLTYLRQGIKPTENAVAALERASMLAPFDQGLRMTAAMQELRDGKSTLARAYLVPIAYNPHGGGMAEFARKMIEHIDKDPKWNGSGADVPADGD